MDVNGGLNLQMQAPNNGVAGPFFKSLAVNAPLIFTVKGLANSDYVLVAGPLHRNNVVSPGIGSLDVGFLANFGDIIVVLDGTKGDFINSLANTSPSGTSTLNFAVPSLPPGIWVTFQSAVFTSGATIQMTAATQVTVL